jgi:DNA-binding response OmpR family regulator
MPAVENRTSDRPPQPNRGSTPAAALSRGQRSRDIKYVLIVEDDAPIRGMLTDVLYDAGYLVVEASDGAQAVEELRQMQPDLIVLDLMLPQLSGWQFLERCRDQIERANIPVLILSAIKGRGDYPSSLGAAEWLTKPVDLDQFLETVEVLTRPPSADTHIGKHVLVVEDENLIRDVIVDRLVDDGFEPEIAGTLAEARRKIKQNQPSLILLDLMLPDENGWAFLRERSQDPRLATIPVIAISAATRERLLEARELGADAFLSKPFDLEALTVLCGSFVR